MLKSLHAGHVYQLTASSQLTESSLRQWFENLLSLFTVEEQAFIQKTKYLWRKGDIFKSQALLMFPANRGHLASLFKQHRLTADMFDPKLTTAEMAVLTADGPDLDYAIKAEGANPVCTVCSNDCVGTCNGHRAVFNKVVKYITGGMYSDATKAFGEATEARKALNKFQNTARRFILPSLVEPFNNGKYTSWTALVNSTRRAFNIQEDKVTLSNLFNRIQEAASADGNMENKIDALSTIAMDIAITDEADYFRPVDFEGDYSQTMSAPEQYGPLVNTLLTYIVMRETVPKTKWTQVQSNFERKIQSGWSYRNWHENRPQLYETLDSIKKETGKICLVNPKESEADGAAHGSGTVDDEVNATDADVCPVFQKRSGWGQKAGKPSRRPYPDKSFQRHQPSQEDRRRENRQAPRTPKNLCACCTHFHPHKMTVYHPDGSGFGGNGKYCIYDANGKERSDANGRTINAIEFDCVDAPIGTYPILANVEMFDTVDMEAEPEQYWGVENTSRD